MIWQMLLKTIRQGYNRGYFVLMWGGNVKKCQAWLGKGMPTGDITLTLMGQI